MSRLPTVDDLQAMVAHIAEHRPGLARVFTVPHDGEPWTIACDGHALLALRGDRGCPPPEATPDFQQVLRVRPMDGFRPVDAGALLAWANAAAPDPATCPTCEGRGFTTECSECGGKGDAVCICDNCGDDHSAECGECDGSGEVSPKPCGDCEKPREAKGWFGPALMNREHFYRWLRWLPADAMVEASVPQAERAAMLRGADWFALIMPMRRHEELLDLDTFNGWSRVRAPEEVSP